MGPANVVQPRSVGSVGEVAMMVRHNANCNAHIYMRTRGEYAPVGVGACVRKLRVDAQSPRNEPPLRLDLMGAKLYEAAC